MRWQVAIGDGRKSAFASQPAPGVYALNRHRRLFSVFVAGSLALELGALLGLISRKIGRVWARSMFGLHWSIPHRGGNPIPLPTLRHRPAGGTRTVGSAKYSFWNAATRTSHRGTPGTGCRARSSCSAAARAIGRTGQQRRRLRTSMASRVGLRPTRQRKARCRRSFSLLGRRGTALPGRARPRTR
jgi:hypothetical protein